MSTYAKINLEPKKNESTHFTVTRLQHRNLKLSMFKVKKSVAAIEIVADLAPTLLSNCMPASPISLVVRQCLLLYCMHVKKWNGLAVHAVEIGVHSYVIR
jgi:hypothetical protein